MTCREGHAPKYPDFQPGNTLARTHGVWAKDASDEARRVVGLLLPAEDIARYPAVALVFAETWIRWRRALADIERRGDVIGDGAEARPHPLLTYADRFARSLLDMASRFGLDPRSEAGLARERAEATRSVSDLDAIAEAGRRARLAAEARGELPAASQPAETDRAAGDSGQAAGGAPVGGYGAMAVDL